MAIFCMGSLFALSSSIAAHLHPIPLPAPPSLVAPRLGSPAACFSRSLEHFLALPPQPNTLSSGRIDDLVMVQVRSIAEMGAYVSLLEYNNIEGMILLSELSRRRIRSINKLIRVGKQEVCMVLRVDKEKGYIDLSKRRVSPEDLQKCDERFQRSKAVHSILRHVSEVKSVDMEGLYRQTAWPLYEKFGHAYEAFRAAITDPDSIFNEELMPGLDPDLRKAILENIEKRLTPTAVKACVAPPSPPMHPVLPPPLLSSFHARPSFPFYPSTHRLLPVEDSVQLRSIPSNSSQTPTLTRCSPQHSDPPPHLPHYVPSRPTQPHHEHALSCPSFRTPISTRTPTPFPLSSDSC